MYRERCVILQITLKFCLLFIDLGRFKVVNDELGHDTGDQLAIEAARCLHAVLQGDDEVDRFGGDEFVTWLRGVDLQENLAAVCKKITLLVQMPLIARDTIDVLIGESIGAAMYPADGKNRETLMHIADVLMFGDKKYRKEQ